MKLTSDYISQILGLDMHNLAKRVKLLNETMSRTDIVKLLKLLESHKLRELSLKELLKDMNTLMKPAQIVETFDKVGVIRRGYWALSRLWLKN